MKEPINVEFEEKNDISNLREVNLDSLIRDHQVPLSI